jgi:pyruvate/2-oxoglutarate dehydrogenase complex dihydrolipoamide acyltransferase (E2) component
MGIDEATVVRWLKGVGDQVRQGEILVELETAKALQEVEAPVSGRLVSIVVREGQVAIVNSALAHIDESSQE